MLFPLIYIGVWCSLIFEAGKKRKTNVKKKNFCLSKTGGLVVRVLVFWFYWGASLNSVCSLH